MLGLGFVLTTSLLSCQIGLMQASAPDDADAFCSNPALSPVYASNIRVLLDSYNYINLLPPHDGAVWQQIDRDANNPPGIVTEWMQNRNTPCRQNVVACGFNARPQNNWLITQHIKTNVEGLTHVRILVHYELTCRAEFCAREFVLWKREAPVVSSAKVRNIRGYQMVARVHDDDRLAAQQNTTVNIDLSTDEDGFYLAIVDEGTCIEVTRLIVFYNVCPAGVVSLATTTETIAPHIESISQPTQVVVECVEGATPENGVLAQLNCNEDGVWTSIPGSRCICNPGFVASQNGLSCEAITINFSSENCTSRVGCYTSLPANDTNTSIHCNISYGEISPSSHLPGSPIVLEVNSSSPIPISGFRNIHYEVTANVSSYRIVTFNGVVNKTDGFPPRLMGLNNWLIGLGALFTSAAIIVCIIVGVVEQYSLRKNRYLVSELVIVTILIFCIIEALVSYWLPLVLWLLSVVFVVVCIVVWIGMGYQVNSQEDTCDSVWISTRDSLVSLVFALSLMALGFGVAAAIAVSCFTKCRNQPEDNVITAPPATPFDTITPIYDDPPTRDVSYNREPSFIDIGESSVCGDYWYHEGSQSDSRSYCQDVYSHQDYGSERTREGHHSDVYSGASPHYSRNVYI